MPLGVGVLALTGGLTAATFVKAIGIGLLGQPRSDRRRSRGRGPGHDVGRRRACWRCYVWSSASRPVSGASPPWSTRRGAGSASGVRAPLGSAVERRARRASAACSPRGCWRSAWSWRCRWLPGPAGWPSAGALRRTEAWGCGQGGPDGPHAVHGHLVRRAADPGVRRRACARPMTSTSATVAESRYYVEAATFHTSTRRRLRAPRLPPRSSVASGWWGTPGPPGPERQRAPLPGLRAGRAGRRAGGARMSGVLAGRLGGRRGSCSRSSAVVARRPAALGLMRKVRCRLEGRVGPPIRQPLLDLRKLVRKERTRPEQASWMFSAAPLVLVATALRGRRAIAPLLATDPAFGWSADLFAVVFLLLVGSVALALGALDTGTAFGGMGASRAMTIGALGRTGAAGRRPRPLDAGPLVEPARPSSAAPWPIPAWLASPAAAAWPGGLPDRDRGRERAAAGRQPEHPPRADDDPRGHGPRVRRPRPGPGQAGRGDAPRSPARPASPTCSSPGASPPPRAPGTSRSGSWRSAPRWRSLGVGAGRLRGARWPSCGCSGCPS